MHQVNDLIHLTINMLFIHAKLLWNKTKQSTLSLIYYVGVLDYVMDINKVMYSHYNYYSHMELQLFYIMK